MPSQRDEIYRVDAVDQYQDVHYSNEEVEIKYVDEPFPVYEYQPRIVKQKVVKLVPRPVPYVVKQVRRNKCLYEER